MADTATNPPTGPSGPSRAGDAGPSGSLGATASSPPSPRPTAAPPPATPSSGDDWAKDIVDRLDEVVAKIRSNTTDRLVRIGRLIVLGLLAAIFGVTALILVLIALVRGLDILIPGPVWEVYVILGAIFVVAGVFLWTKKDPRPARR